MYAVRTLAEEIRRARLEHGLSQEAVARAVRISRPQLGRIERGENKAVSVLALARVVAVLGLELSVRAYPAGQPIRDAAHRALLDRARAAIGSRAVWTNERPIGGSDDLRAWDAMARYKLVGVGVEAETRVSDLQALQRRVMLKLRDDPPTAFVLLVLANSRHNRDVVRGNEAAILADFRILTVGELATWQPEGNALVLL